MTARAQGSLVLYNLMKAHDARVEVAQAHVREVAEHRTANAAHPADVELEQIRQLKREASALAVEEVRKRGVEVHPRILAHRARPSMIDRERAPGHGHPDRLAAVLAASYGMHWDDLPEDAMFRLSKNKLRRRAAEAEAAHKERAKYPKTDPRAWKM